MPSSHVKANISRCHDAATDHPNEHANRMIWYVSSILTMSTVILTTTAAFAHESKSTVQKTAEYAEQC